MIKMEKDISYQEYRKRIEELKFLKEKLIIIMKEKRVLHNTYRHAFKEYRLLNKEEEELRNKLIEMV